MIIKQIMEPKLIQTCLAVEVDGIRVDYRKTPSKFEYEFSVLLRTTNPVITRTMADEAIERVADMMCAQSYDHGSQWRRVCKETFTDKYGQYIAKIEFRIHDAG